MNEYYDKNTQVMSVIKIELYPTIEQFNLINLYIQANDFIYNKIIDLEELVYKEYLQGLREDGFLGRFKIQPYISELKRNIDWLNNIPLHICRGGGFRAVNAYCKFFKGCANKPVYKTNYNKSRSYSVRADRLHFINCNYIKTEGIKEPIKCQTYNFNFNIKIYDPIIKIDSCNRVWLSFSHVINKTKLQIPASEPIGIDLGFRLDNSNTIVCSNGMIFSQPDTKILEYNLQKLNEICTKDNLRIKEIANELGVNFHDVEMSKNMMKRRMKLNSTYAKIHNIKNTFYDQTVAYLVSLNPEYIVVEDISINQLQQNNPFVDFGHFSAHTFVRKLEIKCNQYYIPFIKVDNKDYPSSQICSNCKSMYPINRCTDNYKCPTCGIIINRDINAAINLKNYPKEYLNM